MKMFHTGTDRVIIISINLNLDVPICDYSNLSPMPYGEQPTSAQTMQTAHNLSPAQHAILASTSSFPKKLTLSRQKFLALHSV